MISASVSETKLRLDTAASAVLDASGAGRQTNVGPTSAGERWKITILSASGPAVAKLQVMRGNSFNASQQLDMTRRADGDTSATSIELMSGETISFWWTGGTVGATMRCSVQGDRFLPGQRAY